MAVILDMNEDLEEVVTAKIRAEGVDEYDDEEHMAVQVGEYLSDYIHEQLPEIQFSWNAFFDSAIEKVNWEELAEHYLKDWGFLTRRGRKVRRGPKEWSP